MKITFGLGHASFTLEPSVARGAALRLGFVELAVDGAHAAAVADLPAIHKDPFDRLLVAQASVAGLPSLTHGPVVPRYPGPVRLV
ncbi:type II toxin-antitoxin system VapC family toxin [Cellulomonas sp. PhB143]|uniref:type II toxin-antitoxin system VapC family toxin n=1 Tax=Cellulomonas sp. PhB143 TaxID=2485186 RepID=UPI000F4600F8|nr:PIN domain nuclease [Cellulomonas sp. PhB143]